LGLFRLSDYGFVFCFFAFLPARRFGCCSCGVGLSLHSCRAVGVALGCLPTVLAFPCILSGLLASPLCGAAPTFFAAAKKVGKEKRAATASL
jgi:hypothetical protein